MLAEYIFVYGTLRRACATGAHDTYLAGAEFIDHAKVRGRLYRVSYYPALVLDETADWVIGEVYRINPTQLIELDAYEECTYPSEPAHEYQRQTVQLTTASGMVLSAWVYTYQHSTQNLEYIAQGDFFTA